MAQIVTYDPDDADLVLTTRRPEDSQFSESAYFGEADTGGKVVVDDDDSSIEIVGLKRVEVLETAAPVGDQRLYTGFVGARPYRRSKNYGTVGPLAREIEIPLTEINTVVGDLFLRGSTWNRKTREKASHAPRRAPGLGLHRVRGPRQGRLSRRLDGPQRLPQHGRPDPSCPRSRPSPATTSPSSTTTRARRSPSSSSTTSIARRSTRPTGPGSATRQTRIPTIPTSSCRSIPGRASSSSATRRTSARAPSTTTPRARSTRRRPPRRRVPGSRRVVGSTTAKTRTQASARPGLAERPRRGRGHDQLAIDGLAGRGQPDPAWPPRVRDAHLRARARVRRLVPGHEPQGQPARGPRPQVPPRPLAQAAAPDLHEPDRDPRGPRHGQRSRSAPRPGRRPGPTRRSRAGSEGPVDTAVDTVPVGRPDQRQRRRRTPTRLRRRPSWLRNAGTVAFYCHRRARRDLRDLPPRGHGRRGLEPVAEPPARPDRLLGRRRLDRHPGRLHLPLAAAGPRRSTGSRPPAASRRRSSARSTSRRACPGSPACGNLFPLGIRVYDWLAYGDAV
jgi:hypothetical protein